MKKTLALVLIFVFIFSTVYLPSCSDKNELYSDGSGSISIVCTVFPVFDFARNVGGDKVTVTLLQDSGADMHSYTPTAKILKAVGEANIFAYIGGDSESSWVGDMLEAAGNSTLKTVNMSSHIETLLIPETTCDWSNHTHENHRHESGFDEHFWTSLENAEDMAEAICRALCEVDPENSVYYKDNTSKYTEKLDILEDKYEKAFENATAPTLIFADRFPFVYLLHDYSFSYTAAFGGCSSETDASYETLSEICSSVKNNSVKSVLTIDGSDKKLANSVKEQTGCEILTVNSLQSVTRSDIEKGINYIDVMTENLEIFRAALGSK